MCLQITKMDFVSLGLCTLYFVAFLLIVSVVHRHYQIHEKLKNIPQVGRYPFGAMFELLNRSNYEMTKILMKQFEEAKHQGIYKHWLIGQAYINIFHPEYVKVILDSKNITKGFHYKLLEAWLGKGLITSTGEQWSHDRKLIRSSFYKQMLNHAIIQSEKAEILITRLERKIEENPGEAIDICPFMFNCTLDIIWETAMGVDLRAQEPNIVTEYTTAVHQISELTMTRFFQPWYWINWLFYLSPKGKQYKSILKTLHEFTKQVIYRKQAERQSQNSYTKFENDDDEFNIGKQKRKAFLDLLLDENEKNDSPLTDDELKAQIDTFMFAGHDTNALALIWTLFLLGNNLEHQEEVHKELETVFGDSVTPASQEQLSQLEYLNRVIKESHRILPSVPLITRKLVEDVKLGNNVIPKGMTVAITIMFLHRNPEIWPNPLKFDPDRFLPENSYNRPKCAFIPFSSGQRSCIGQQFAAIEQKIILTAILRKWRVKSVKTIDTIKYSASVLLRPEEKVLIHFTPKK
ncbi:cytochrome P450 4C1-like [Solenopsis invicta]|uniref:cytochrome P450 4C1-like n=1 Tax=Solenopsis invicta TaxID=13686 RepID=UPI00193DEC31|nr:cytochrome P450 4C1-like [Solenopsis invicta]